MIGPRRTVLIVMMLGLSSCGASSSATATLSPSAHSATTPSPAPVYDFAGLNQSVDQVEGLRATITWTVPPKLIPGSGYAVSTWIAFAARQGTGGVSYQIAQVGWIETDPGHPRLFWEWGTSRSETHKQLGADVKEARPLNVEVDWDGLGVYRFYADGILLGKGSASWTPTDIGIFVETQNPAELLPGSATEPELITGLEQEIGGNWVPYIGKVLTTRDQFRVDVALDGSVRIWDIRQPSSL